MKCFFLPYWTRKKVITPSSVKAWETGSSTPGVIVWIGVRFSKSNFKLHTKILSCSSVAMRISLLGI